MLFNYFEMTFLTFFLILIMLNFMSFKFHNNKNCSHMLLNYMIIVLFIYILILNMYSLIPYSLSLTSQLSVPFFLTFFFFMGVYSFYIYNNFYLFLCDLCPSSVSNILSMLIIIIETLSLFIRPVALFLRLFANITAGHILLNFIMSSMSVFFLWVVLPLVILECAVSVIQSYIFILLITLWCNDLTLGLN